MISTSTTTQEPEEIIEGSGDIIDQETCKGLYNSWDDPDFQGGKPPPLSPDEDINRELCDHILSVARASCETGSVLEQTELCKYYNRHIRPEFDIGARQKRHKYNNDKYTDDEEMLQMLKDQPARDIEFIEDFSDLSFKEFDHKETNGDILHVEIEPRPQAVYSSNSELLMFNPLTILFAIIYFLVIVFIRN